MFKSANVSLVRTSVSETAMEVDVDGRGETATGLAAQSGLTAQLLMLYYVLLYEDCQLNNMKTLGKQVSVAYLRGSRLA